MYFHELAKRWVRSGTEVFWFSSKFEGSQKEEIIDGIKILRGGGSFGVYGSAFLNYMKRKLPEDVDVIIDVENGIPFFSPFYIKNKKIVLQVHHVHKEVWFKEMKAPFSYMGYFLEAKLMPRVYKKSKLITLSESSAEEILKEKFTKEKPFIVSPGIEFYKIKKYEKTKKPSILFLNRVKKYKGVDTFLKAAKKLKEENENMDFWLAGDGDYLEEMKVFVKENKLGNVKIFGRVSEEKKRELMKKSWVFVNPSFKEGWGIVNIEANYTGTPVIGSNVGGIKDSIANNKTGLLFEYGNHAELADKIKLIVKDKKLRQKLIMGGLSWAKKFDWDNKAEQYLNILKSI